MRRPITPDYLRERAAAVRSFTRQKLSNDPDLAATLLRLAEDLEATANKLERDSDARQAS